MSLETLEDHVLVPRPELSAALRGSDESVDLQPPSVIDRDAGYGLGIESSQFIDEFSKQLTQWPNSLFEREAFVFVERSLMARLADDTLLRGEGVVSATLFSGIEIGLDYRDRLLSRVSFVAESDLDDPDRRVLPIELQNFQIVDGRVVIYRSAVDRLAMELDLDEPWSRESHAQIRALLDLEPDARPQRDIDALRDRLQQAAVPVAEAPEPDDEVGWVVF